MSGCQNNCPDCSCNTDSEEKKVSLDFTPNADGSSDVVASPKKLVDIPVRVEVTKPKHPSRK